MLKRAQVVNKVSKQKEVVQRMNDLVENQGNDHKLAASAVDAFL